jgi:hypothetical protein
MTAPLQALREIDLTPTERMERLVADFFLPRSTSTQNMRISSGR